MGILTLHLVVPLFLLELVLYLQLLVDPLLPLEGIWPLQPVPNPLRVTPSYPTRQLWQPLLLQLDHTYPLLTSPIFLAHPIDTLF